jgi:hypothetical protein
MEMREDADQETALGEDHHRSEVAEQIAQVIRAQHDKDDAFLAPGTSQRVDEWLAEHERRQD